jgi:hypothetical protein
MLVFTNEVVIHIFALAVPLGVAPLGAWLLDRPGRASLSLAAGAFVVPTFAFHRGTWAGLWVAPWLAVAFYGAAIEFSIWALHRSWTLEALAPFVSAAFLSVAAGALLASRSGITTGRVAEPIVELTSVHYGFAGFGATLLAASALRASRRGRQRIAGAALAATMASPPVVALGFLTGWALPQVGGAAVLAAGVWVTAGVTLVDARPRARNGTTALLMTIAGLAPLAPMVLAVAWAAAQHWAVLALDIPAMARVHGSANALGFVGCGLLGYGRLLRQRPVGGAFA